jgi:hypothetical protein
MRFSSFLVGLCLASLGAAFSVLFVGGGIGQALLFAVATFILGQLLYVGLIAMMARDEQRDMTRPQPEDSPRAQPAAPSAKSRAS